VTWQCGPNAIGYCCENIELTWFQSPLSLSRFYGAGWILSRVRCFLRRGGEGAVFRPGQLCQAGADFGGFPVRGRGRAKKGKKGRFLEKMACFKGFWRLSGSFSDSLLTRKSQRTASHRWQPAASGRRASSRAQTLPRTLVCFPSPSSTPARPPAQAAKRRWSLR